MKVGSEMVRGQKRWVLDFGRVAGRRHRRYFASEAEAKKALEKAEKERDAGGSWWAAQPEPVRARTIAVAREIGSAGLTLDAVWDAYQASLRSEGGNGAKEIIPLKRAISECLALKRTTNCSSDYIASLEGYLDRLARYRGAETPVHVISPADITRFLQHAKCPASRQTTIGRISALFTFCVQHGYLKENPCRAVGRIRVTDRDEPVILTVDQAREAFRFTEREMPEFLPYLTLSLLVGIRPHEIPRMTPDMIDLRRRFIKLPARITKTRRPRLIERTLMPSAIAWLRRCDLEDLPMRAEVRRYRIGRLRAALGLESWPKDVLRHTAASHLVAHHQDAALVSLELGNSPATLFRHYRNLVTKQQAAAFWKIIPAGKPSLTLLASQSNSEREKTGQPKAQEV